MRYGQVEGMKNRPGQVQSNGNSQNVKQESKNTVGLCLYIRLHDDVLPLFNWLKSSWPVMMNAGGFFSCPSKYR